MRAFDGEHIGAHIEAFVSDEIVEGGVMTEETSL